VTDVLYGLDGDTREWIAALREQGRFAWLDATSGGEPVESRGSASRSFHADDESISFVLRCYVEREETDDDRRFRLEPLDVRVFITGDFMLTRHEEDVSLPELLAVDLPDDATPRQVVYSVLGAMLASGFDALEEIELMLDAFASMLTDGGGVPRSMLRQAATRLAPMRRWVSAEHAVFERLRDSIGSLPGFGGSQEPDFERLHAQADRLGSAIDAAVEGAGMLVDLQLNERAYVATVVATVFVPLGARDHHPGRHGRGRVEDLPAAVDHRR
jgi:Mg2+ and Co2+ transporter CorA